MVKNMEKLYRHEQKTHTTIFVFASNPIQGSSLAILYGSATPEN